MEKQSGRHNLLKVRPCLIFLVFQPVFREAFFRQPRRFVDLLRRFVEYGYQGAVRAADLDWFDQTDKTLFINNGFHCLYHVSVPRIHHKYGLCHANLGTLACVLSPDAASLWGRMLFEPDVWMVEVMLICQAWRHVKDCSRLRLLRCPGFLRPPKPPKPRYPLVE